MSIFTLGIALAKQVFALQDVNTFGKAILSKASVSSTK